MTIKAKSIAIATGNTSMNEELEKTLADQKVMVVHFKEFLLAKDFDLIILSNKLRGNIDLEGLIHHLKKASKRVIFLTDINAQDDIDLCIKYGVHDILYQEITVSKVKDLLEKPNTVADISHLITANKISVNKAEDKDQSSPKGNGKWLDLFTRTKKEKLQAPLSDYPEEVDTTEDTVTNKVSQPERIKVQEEKEEISKLVKGILIEDNDLFDEAKQDDSGKDHLKDIKESIEAIKVPQTKPQMVNQFMETQVKKVSGDVIKADSATYHKTGQEEVNKDSKENLKKLVKALEKKKKRKVLSISNLRVVVTGQSSNIGTSHTALLFAYAAKGLGAKKIALVNGGAPDDYHEFFDFFGAASKRTMKLKGVEFFKDEKDLITRINDFNVIIFDMGLYKKSHMKSIYKMANLKIIVAEGNPYKRRGLLEFFKDFASQEHKAFYALPLASDSQVMDFKRFMETKRVFSVPANKVFYEPKESMVRIVEKLMSGKVRK